MARSKLLSNRYSVYNVYNSGSFELVNKSLVVKSTLEQDLEDFWEVKQDEKGSIVKTLQGHDVAQSIVGIVATLGKLQCTERASCKSETDILYFAYYLEYISCR